MTTSAERERTIRAAWDERGSKLWKSEIHGRGLTTPTRSGQPLPQPNMLEFRLVRSTMNGHAIDSIVCEGVVVAMLP
jgi:hypothetical protein